MVSALPEAGGAAIGAHGTEIWRRGKPRFPATVLRSVAEIAAARAGTRSVRPIAPFPVRDVTPKTIDIFDIARSGFPIICTQRAQQKPFRAVSIINARLPFEYGFNTPVMAVEIISNESKNKQTLIVDIIKTTDYRITVYTL